MPPLDLGADKYPRPQPQWEEFAPRRPGAIGRLFGGQTRYQHLLQEAQAEFERERLAHGEQETQRQRRVAERKQAHAVKEAQARRAVEEHNASIDALARGLHARDRQAVERYLGLVVERVPLPKGFPHTAEVTYSDHGEQVVAQVELPGRAVVPAVRGYQYVRSRDAEREQPRPAKEIGELYGSVVSQVALLCVRDLFDSDEKVRSVSFNGHVWATNPATGQREYPCLISLSVQRETFEQLVLDEVAPEHCLRYLHALVSPHPYDLEPITPIVDFDLTKYSFVEGLDAVSALDSRPDLMQMSPTEFEHLVRQVFEATGVEGWTTQQSNDDGVDAVVVNKTPIRSGLSIVQAKRYKAAVGVSHVRELAGAMEEKKAGHGILVTTSWFTQGCWKKAREHGRMELIDGPRLKSLIKEYLDKDVLIGIQRPPSANTGPQGGEP